MGGIGIGGTAAQASIFFCTIANNVGSYSDGIYISGGNTLNINNSIVVGSGTSIYSNGSSHSGGYNVLGKIFEHAGGVKNFTFGPDDVEDIASTAVFGSNEQLADNGGPTRTVALVLSALNPAINTMPWTSQTHGGTLGEGYGQDQRGEPRPGRNKIIKWIDSGAYETQEPTDVIKVTGVSLNKSSTMIKIGETEKLSAAITPSNATNKKITWSSSNSAIATVSDGNVTGVANGNATITVTTYDGGKTATCAVTVSADVKATGVSMDKSSTTIKIGESEKLSATVLPANATKKTVTWSSNNSAIATVSDGTVTGVAIGNATITVKTDDGNFTANCAVTISSADVKVTGVSLNKSSATIKIGETEKLSAAISPANATNQKITWSSNNNAIATVSDGTVTGVANGNATITVKTDDGALAANCAILVSTDAPPESADLVLTTRTINLTEGESAAIASNSDGTWQTSDNSIIDMKTSARSAEITAKKLGKATITFTRTSDKKTAEVSVFVEVKAMKDINDKLKSKDVGIHILSPDIFTSVDTRIEPTAPTMVCYEPSGKPAGVIEVNISDTVKYPDVNNVFLPMQYSLGLSEAEIKKSCENVGREINMGRLFSKDGTPDSDIVDEFFRVFVIQKEILQGTKKGQMARLLGQGKDQTITPGDAIKSGILSLNVSVAERKVHLEFRYLVKDGDMPPVFNGKDLIIGDGLGDRLIVDPLWTNMRKATGGTAPDGGSGCNAGFGLIALILISYPIYRIRFLAIFLIIFASATGAFAAESVGVIEDAVPQSWAVRGGSKNELRVGDEIFVSDTIATDEAGKLDVQFADGTTIALGPNSEAVIKDFVMSDTKNNFEAGVLKGAARVVTGGLVKRNPNGFKVTTPRSTIGIRGTTLTFGVDKRGNEIVSVTDIGDNSHVTIISQSGKRHTVNTPGNSYFAPIGREGAVIKNNDAINRMVEQLIDVADTGVAVDELLKDVFEEVERQVVEQGVAPAPPAPGGTGTDTTEKKKEVNVVADVRPSPRNIGNCD